jgi:hypothetical protein
LAAVSTARVGSGETEWARNTPSWATRWTRSPERAGKRKGERAGKRAGKRKGERAGNRAGKRKGERAGKRAGIGVVKRADLMDGHSTETYGDV